MRVFSVSDIHIDYKDNYNWLFSLPPLEYQEDILILAGDVTDNLELLKQCFLHLNQVFYKVMFVPGNHELWVREGDVKSSIDKFNTVIELADICGIYTQPIKEGRVTIIPLFSWYDLTFGRLEDGVSIVWTDFRNCFWPQDYTLYDVTSYFLNKNSQYLNEEGSLKISFSHFVPWIELMPEYIPEKHRKIYPLLGSSRLGEQINTIKPAIHVYGHSHINQSKIMGGVKYINNALGYPSEKWFEKELLCIYES